MTAQPSKEFMMRSPCEITFHRNPFLHPHIGKKADGLSKFESHMLVRILLKEVDSGYIKPLIPEKDRRKGREMVTLSERRMLIALNLHLL